MNQESSRARPSGSPNIRRTSVRVVSPAAMRLEVCASILVLAQATDPADCGTGTGMIQPAQPDTSKVKTGSPWRSTTSLSLSMRRRMNVDEIVLLQLTSSIEDQDKIEVR